MRWADSDHTKNQIITKPPWPEYQSCEPNDNELIVIGHT